MPAEARVVVTRPQGQEGPMMAAVRSVGWRALHVPALAIEPRTPDARERRHLMNLDQYRAVIFVSANAVEYGLEALGEYWPQWPVGVHWIAVGAATAEALRTAGLPAEAPAKGFNSEAVLELPCLQQLSECSVLLLRGKGGRALLEQSLTERGAKVDRVELYRRVCAEAVGWPEEAVDAVLVTSVESWQCLWNRAGHALQGLCIVAGSERIAEAVRADGVGCVAAASPRDEDMLECLKANLSPE